MTTYTRVTIDEERCFPALVDSQRWNGFLAAPRFSSGVVDDILSHHGINYVWEGSTVVVFDENAPDPYGDDADPTAPDGDGLYPLGAFGWTWVECDGCEECLTDEEALALLPGNDDVFTSVLADPKAHRDDRGEYPRIADWSERDGLPRPRRTLDLDSFGGCTDPTCCG